MADAARLVDCGGVVGELGFVGAHDLVVLVEQIETVGAQRGIRQKGAGAGSDATARVGAIDGPA